MIAAHNVYGLVRPDCSLSPASITVHTLRPADLVGAPPLSEAVDISLAAAKGQLKQGVAESAQAVTNTPSTKGEPPRKRTPARVA